MHRGRIRLREVASDDIDAGLHERGNKADFAREPIQINNYRVRLMQTANAESPRNGRMIIPLSTVYLFV
jgi:hypothetical protein